MHQRLKQLSGPVILVGLLLAGGLFFAMTNPRNVPSIVLVAGFGLLFAVFYVALRLGTGLISRNRLLTRQRRQLLIWLGAALPTLLLLLQSIGQLTLKDILTLLILFAVGYFYVARATLKT